MQPAVFMASDINPSSLFQHISSLQQNLQQCRVSGKLQLRKREIQKRIENAQNRVRVSVGDERALFAARLELSRAKSDLEAVEEQIKSRHNRVLSFYSHASALVQRQAGPTVVDDDDDSIADAESGKKRARIVDIFSEGCLKKSKNGVSPAMFNVDGNRPDTTQMLHRVLNKSNLNVINSNTDYSTQRASIIQQTVCPFCGEQRTINHSTSYMECSSCGLKTQFTSVGAHSFPYGTDFENGAIGYQRRSHLSGIIRQSLGSSKKADPDGVRILKQHLETHNMQISSLNIEDVQVILQRNQRKDLVDNAVEIMCEAKGVPPPSQGDPERLRMLAHCFLKAEETFIKKRSEVGRNNFTYYPTIRLLCILLGYDDLVPLFPPLKTIDKRNKASDLLKIIFEENCWEFFDPNTVAEFM